MGLGDQDMKAENQREKSGRVTEIGQVALSLQVHLNLREDSPRTAQD